MSKRKTKHGNDSDDEQTDENGQENAEFQPGDNVIARGGERGTVEKVERHDPDPKDTLYTVQFGGRLGTLNIRGEELQKLDL